MQIEQNGDILSVSVTPKLLLEKFVSGQFKLKDVDYLCGMMYQLGIGRMKKKKATEIPLDDGSFGDGIDIIQSVNMCLGLLESAGMSLKGLARFRQHARENCYIKFSGSRATSSRFNCRRHISLDIIADFESTHPLYKRAMQKGFQFVDEHLRVSVHQHEESCVLRIGLLTLATENNPEFVLTNHFLSPI